MAYARPGRASRQYLKPLLSLRSRTGDATRGPGGRRGPKRTERVLRFIAVAVASSPGYFFTFNTMARWIISVYYVPGLNHVCRALKRVSPFLLRAGVGEREAKRQRSNCGDQRIENFLGRVSPPRGCVRSNAREGCYSLAGGNEWDFAWADVGW